MRKTGHAHSSKRSSRKQKSPLDTIKKDERKTRLGRVPGTNVGHPCKGTTWGEIIAEIMQEEELDGRKRKELIARRMIELASYGDQKAAEWLADREEGKPISTTKFEGQAPVQINMTKFSKEKKR